MSKSSNDMVLVAQKALASEQAGRLGLSKRLKAMMAQMSELSAVNLQLQVRSRVK